MEILRVVVPTISYNSKHAKHEDPEEEFSYVSQEDQKTPTQCHGEGQATAGKTHNKQSQTCSVQHKTNIKVRAFSV